ncbi:Fe-S oxidoreductase [Microbacterium sp. Root61]|uniref:hypothetical protein n=1 Tax=Microbacterium sp. Root61 TaxID=1736570 RepID=UPI00070148CA|nr:hypothetical protein [Microbacterium sp. Root61]KRA23278.1 Fe-S oxidoreductase [Microbacterium sp. Root61]
MQLGTRWTAGEQPPAAVPAALHTAIAEADAAALAAQDGGYAPRWTLTWLEKRPIAELDTGVIVRLTATGEVTVEHDDDLD